MAEVIIHDGNAQDFQDYPGQSKGLVPRDYTTHPVGCYRSARAVSFDLIPRSEWHDRILEKVALKSQLSDIVKVGNYGKRIPSRDQNGKGYCWFHSGTAAVIALRAAMNLPYVSLSAYAGACVIKDFRDEGGWGAQGVDFITERGVPSEEFWPQQSMSRANDKPATWENAKLHRLTEGFYDLDAAQYDRNLTFDQLATCLLLNIPVVTDFNWWGHSVCALDLVEVESNSFGIRIWNSWGDSWSDQGMGILTGSKAIPDGAVAPRVTTASVA